jgi:F-type H+-transporting ATPase subunit gamma
MEGAEKNIEEKREEMETEYQRLRQGAITGELLDIVAGYETLTGTGPSGN